jgi:hypothetical protein
VSKVDAADYDSFWLWAGVRPQPVLKQARTIYLHYAEIRQIDPDRLEVLRPQMPRLQRPDIWLVLRIETLRFPGALMDRVITELVHWRDAGNKVAGLQIDFDARTRFLSKYAAFLAKIRRQLPKDFKLSITGLLDWSANGDPAGLDDLSAVIDTRYVARDVNTLYMAAKEKLDKGQYQQLQLPCSTKWSASIPIRPGRAVRS